ncbi:MAG: dihydroxyacetone kinase subunit L [Clostridiales bacterium]|nr:dihydroxyacetone kinase subunit L [Clostridiales bacterium]MDD7432604.1 dihydroxyacetone kinase subunit DhaL [Clostridiales bacterium]MDY3061831.1 dihydroxyacetone kinase subunit DhaL [Eubacteriales bacterium]
MNEEQFIRWIKAYAKIIEEQKEQLTDLDREIGDGDHGVNMNRGFAAVKKKLESAPAGGLGGIAKLIASTLISTVGGASGPLYGTFFLKMAITLGAKNEVSGEDLQKAMEAGVQGIKTLGKSDEGEKTMLDTLCPALKALRQALSESKSTAEAFAIAAEAAKSGMEATIPMLAKKGRASYLGERSVGHQDPGATSAYFLIKTAAEALA